MEERWFYDGRRERETSWEERGMGMSGWARSRARRHMEGDEAAAIVHCELDPLEHHRRAVFAGCCWGGDCICDDSGGHAHWRADCSSPGGAVCQPQT